jgi:hypothetical protein
VVFLCGLAPVALALFVRLFVRESEHWRRHGATTRPPSPRELFGPGVRGRAASGLYVSVTALLTWWACNAFIPLLGSTLAGEHASAAGFLPAETRALAESWKSQASNAFNFGGLAGTFAAIPLARLLSRRAMYMTYFIFSALALSVAFGLDLAPEARIDTLFFVGMGVYGIFVTHVFYLPELFPTRLRGTGAGATYNIGRVIAATGPILVGSVSAAAGGSSAVILQALLWVAIVPLAAAIMAPLAIVETRGRELPR